MRKILLASIVLIALLLAGCSSTSSDNGQPNSELKLNEHTGQKDNTGHDISGNSDEKDLDDGTIEGSLNTLVNLGRDIKCTFRASETEGEYAQTTYVSGEKIRTDMKMTFDGKTQNVYSIMDDSWIYTWNDITPGKGTKMNIDTFKDQDYIEETDSEEEFQINPDETHSFKCVAWVPDTSKFVPPSDVEFMDLSSITDIATNIMNSQNNGEKIDACSVCDYIPDGKAKEDCLANC